MDVKMGSGGHRESQDRDQRHRRRVLVRFGPDGPEKTAFSTNLSEHGLLLQTNHVFTPGTVLQLEIDPPDQERFSLVGRVVWVKKVPPRLQQVKSCSMGLYFSKPTQEWIDLCNTWND